MRKRVAAVLVILVVAPAAEARERRALLVTETLGFVHDSIPTATAYLRDLGRRSARFDVIPLVGVSQLTDRRLRSADALLFVNTSGEPAALPAPASGAPALRPPRRRPRRRALGSRHATRLAALAGAARGSVHGSPVDAAWARRGRDHAHPATRDLPRAFTINQEFYVFYDEQPRRSAHVVAYLDVGSVGGDPAEDRPLVWCREARRGLVFYDALGHFQQTWADPRQQRLVSGGLRWALGLAPNGGCRHRVGG